MTELVFGPVPSRRLGHSLGINNIPPNTTVPALLKQHQLFMALMYFGFVIPCLKCL